MVRILLCGAAGAMGQVITRFVAERDDCVIAAGVDLRAAAGATYPLFENIAACDVPADVIIDFSHPSLTDRALRFAAEKKMAIVVATTGLSDETVALIGETARKTAVFHAANMSLGINLLVMLAKKAASFLGLQYDIEILEKHHNQKIDAPSGTAMLLAEEINRERADCYHYVFDRHSVRRKRDKREIGIHSVRGGTIVGEHDVIFAGKDEVITLSHSAASKEVFATGAISAALFVSDKSAGLYNMSDLLGS